MSRAVSVETSADYQPSLDELPRLLRGVDIGVVADRVAEFILFKRANGLVPFTRYGEDKPSSRTKDGARVPLFHDNGIHHCHLSLVGPDPIIAYRVPERRRLVIFCVTTHAAMFRGDKRRFVHRYAAHFPATLSRRPRRRPR